MTDDELDAILTRRDAEWSDHAPGWPLYFAALKDFDALLAEVKRLRADRRHPGACMSRKVQQLTAEEAEALRSRGDRWLDAYYFGFDSTGCEAVDLILAAIARAGKMYHSTEWWNDDTYDSPTMVDTIQRAANSAASALGGQR